MASKPALYVVSDVHGHREKLLAALQQAGLTDDAGHWTGGTARLWFLGDLFDRGADGTGIVELIMRLGVEAEAEGGRCDTLLGNHEVLMLAAQRFGDDDLTDEDGNTRNFNMWWRLNGGNDEDVARLTEEQLAWLRSRPAMTYTHDHLLVHTDTTDYASYGRSINAVNRTIRKIVKSSDHARWWELFRRLTIRHRFETDNGPSQATAMLDFFGGRRIVHGHSTIPDRLGIPGSQVNGARLYCDDLVLCVDGGIYQGGPCLVVPLPVPDAALHHDPQLADDEDAPSDDDDAPDETEPENSDDAQASKPAEATS